jgi:transposase
MNRFFAPSASNFKVIAFIKSFESQIKELTGRQILLKVRLNQNSLDITKPPSTNFFIKEKPNYTNFHKKVLKY